MLQVSFIPEVNAMAQQQQPDIKLKHRPGARMYHVTNIKADGDDSRYEYLKTNIAKDMTYDGLLVGLPVVCFTATLYEDSHTQEAKLPTESPYPHGAEGGKRYKRVKVPLNKYQGYDWWEMRLGNDQVHLLFTKDNWSKMLRNAIGPIQFNRVDKQGYAYLQYHEEGENAGWHLNVYDKKVASPFVNISVLDEVKLDDQCDWDVVTRGGAKRGDIRAFVQCDAHYRKERWILEKVLGQKAVEDDSLENDSSEAKRQSQVLRAAATACTVEHRADFQVPGGMDQQQLAKFFRDIAHLLEKAPAELLRSIYHILYAKKD